MNPVRARELCSSHYGVEYRSGALGGRPRKRAAFGSGVRFLRDLAASAPVAECVWMPGAKGTRYPTVKVGGRSRGAHVVSLEMSVGPKPADKVDAAHRCGNGHLGCVNPGHLYWATHVENMADVAALGRTTKPADLTEDQASAVLKLAASLRYSHTEIAQQVGVSVGQVGRLCKKHGIRTNQRRPHNARNDADLEAEIRRLKVGMSQQAVADLLGVSQSYVSRTIRKYGRQVEVS